MTARQRLAWSVLLACFFICVGLAVAVPVGVGTLLQRARRPLDVVVQANQGTVGILFGDNETGALFAGQESSALDPTGSVLTNASDTALVLVENPDSEAILARFQVYGNTNLRIDEGSAPRYSASSAGHTLSMALNSGRLQITVLEVVDRPFEIEVSLPQGSLTIDSPGQYSVVTSNSESQVSVLRGSAAVLSEGARLELTTDQRGVLLASGSIQGPLDTERDLVANGDFASDLSRWVVLADSVEVEGQPSVAVGIDELAGEPALRFGRLGIGHADAGIRQVIDVDVADFESLRLQLALRIEDQSLSVCGQAGSECPLIVRVEFVDGNGVDQVWQQGFYAVGSPGEDTPDVCLTCPPPLIGHQQVPYQQLAFYESENLIERLGQLGIEPNYIKAITLIASGHSFETELVEIGLLAKE